MTVSGFDYVRHPTDLTNNLNLKVCQFASYILDTVHN